MDVCEALDIEDPIKNGMTREQISDAIPFHCAPRKAAAQVKRWAVDEKEG